QGNTTATARCYPSEGALAYTPLIAWLRTDAIHKRLTRLDPLWLTEVARLVPEVLTERPTLPRPDPLVEQWQRSHFFEALARAIAVMEITLGPLDAIDTTSLARAIVGHDLTPTMAATLYQETEGNPLFVVETARMGIPAQEASGQDATHTKSSPRMASATIRA